MKKILVIGLIALSILLVGCSKKEELTGAVVGLSQEPSCQDSDGGINKEVKGILTIGEDTYADACVSGILIEYYCEGNSKANQNIRCPNKCSNGQCI